MHTRIQGQRVVVSAVTAAAAALWIGGIAGCASDNGNTYPVYDVEVSSASHPFWTGQGRILDTAGRVEKFERRYGKRKR